VQALAAVGITAPFAIQTMTLPIALSGHDLIGQARTGTGKTLGFGVPLLQRVKSRAEGADGVPQALVVVPTRELCVQVARDLETAGSVRRIRVQTIYGGRAFEPQVESLRKGVDVVVGTPGRLLDLARQGHLDLSRVGVLVLDEADEMLDLGFLPDVERILEQLPTERQTMLFSATMPGPVVTMARRFMKQPTHIRAEEIGEKRTVPDTKIVVYRAHSMDKGEVLARILQAEGRGLTMVFCRTKRTCDKVAADMADRGFAAAAVHGDLGQGAREQALRAFRSGKIDVLVATDVAARGIDVQDVTHVINYQCPDDESTFLHRIGRTGRAGASGVAVTFVDWDEIPKWKLINKALDLAFEDPVETYSSSRHLYADLGIPEGTKGTLPRSRRVREGLAAEAVEDLGETGRRRAAPARGRAGGSTGTGGGRDDRTEAPAADDAPALPKRSGSPRRRTRGSGAALAAAAGGAGEGEGTPTTDGGGRSGEPDDGEARRPRRRRGGRGRGRGAGGAAPDGSDAGGAAPGAGSDAGNDAGSTAPAARSDAGLADS
jgi:superfamily II DNA/RNA helicase